MLFNSFDYFVFFPIVFTLYWILNDRSIKKRNIMLLIASYYFYSCWDWRFIFLLALSTLIDYCAGILIFKANNKIRRKIYLSLSIGLNLGFLGFFKYYNFFLESFKEFLNNFGLQPHHSTLQIILPVGISFYTFHGISYIIDIYNVKIKPTYNIINYSLFVSFFPLLVAGPIERATHLLPQLERRNFFDYRKSVDGLRQILWGIFKKVAIADSCAIYVNQIFSTDDYSGSTLIIGAILFSFQIYGDFSGYSDIALGCSRLLGIELLKNFNFPYFSRDIAEFWRRWHISLSSWFKDYLYIPLGGSQGGIWNRIKNTFIIFIVSGFWHGANWTFIFWGLLNALFIIPSIVTKTNRNNIEIVGNGSLFVKPREVFQILFTFGLTTFAWIFFRSESLTSAFRYIERIFTLDLFSFPRIVPIKIYLLLFVFIIVEWIGRVGNHTLEKIALSFDRYTRLFCYYIIIILIILFANNQNEFIYFQF